MIRSRIQREGTGTRHNNALVLAAARSGCMVAEAKMNSPTTTSRITASPSIAARPAASLARGGPRLQHSAEPFNRCVAWNRVFARTSLPRCSMEHRSPIQVKSNAACQTSLLAPWPISTSKALLKKTARWENLHLYGCLVCGASVCSSFLVSE